MNIDLPVSHYLEYPSIKDEVFPNISLSACSGERYSANGLHRKQWPVGRSDRQNPHGTFSFGLVHFTWQVLLLFASLNFVILSSMLRFGDQVGAMLATFFEPRRPKTPQGRPQDAPRRPQDTQRHPKTPQDTPKTPPRRPKPSPDDDFARFWTHFRRFWTDFGKTFRNNFLSNMPPWPILLLRYFCMFLWIFTHMLN